MIFTPGTKVYVRYSTGIMNPFTECLTINKYRNNLLYFKEKTSYYAVECHAASFYGYSYTMAGSVMVTRHKWQMAFAGLAEKLKFIVPVKTSKNLAQTSATMRMSVEVS